MLKYGKRIAVALLVAVLAVGFVGTAMSLRLPVPTERYQECEKAAGNNRQKQEQCQTSETLWERSLADPVAYYTLWLTGFTGLLVVVGIAQWSLIAEQIKLGRDEFLSTHPPELVVREVAWGPDPDDEGAEAILFTIANRGRSRCVLLFAEFEVHARREPGRAPAVVDDNPLGLLTFEPSQYRGVHFGGPESLYVAIRKLHFLEDHYFCGTLIYGDRMGIWRRYVFRRFCAKGESRFRPTGDPEDEYTD